MNFIIAQLNNAFILPWRDSSICATDTVNWMKQSEVHDLLLPMQP